MNAKNSTSIIEKAILPNNKINNSLKKEDNLVSNKV
jgi:hypothetical protein